MTPLRVAVVGAGHLGQHHARLYAAMEGCQLVAVVDRDAGRAREVAARHAAPARESAAGLENEIDAVSIAVPTEAHLEAALPFLRAGRAVLVEKPIAADLEQADRMLGAAARGGALLAVGHTERFNPAVEVLAARAGRPRFIEAHRLGSFAPRSLDIDVVADLMIHDIDIARSLVGAPVRSVEAVGVNALTSKVDIANARLVFETGCVANLTASRISAVKTRKIRVFSTASYISCDCAERSVEHYRLEASDRGGPPAIVREAPDVPADEPLRRELERFTVAARGGAPFPVPGAAGREALEIALRIADRIREAAAAAVP